MCTLTNNPFTSIIQLFNDLFAGADEKLMDYILSEDSKYIFLTAPDILITLYRNALQVNSALGIQEQTSFLVNRITILPSDSWQITLYHKDHALNGESWMRRVITLETPQKHNQENRITLYF